MVQEKLISKLGSSSSEIKKNHGKYCKKHLLNNEFEAKAIIRGSQILNNYYPETIEKPIWIEHIKTNETNSNHFIYYEQIELNPWINPEWITGEQLYQLSRTILKQQKLLIKHSLSFVDARPDNYWLVKNKGKLIDLASIKPLTRINLLSFETDFENHFIQPLIFEKDLDIPVSSFLKGKLQSSNINLWGLRRSLNSINYFKSLIRNSLINYISNKIASSSPEFINYLNSNKEFNDNNKSLSYKKANQRLIQIEKKLNSLKPSIIKNSNWKQYNYFHDESYLIKKLECIRSFVEIHKSSSKIIDLGSNLTTKNIEGIDIRIDNDMSICREMRQFHDEDKIVLQLDIAEEICNQKINVKSPINYFGQARSAIITGLIHHLIIDNGLNLETFYQKISILYNNILLEVPLFSDPMVQLLMSKKNEKIQWSWENEHLPKLRKFFNITNKVKLKESRFIVELQKINT